MKSFRLLAAAMLLSTAFGISSANALSFDNETMTNKDGSAKFSDPDEQLEKNFG